MEHLVYCDKKAKVLDKILNGSKTLVASNMDKLNLSNAQVERWAGKKYHVLVEIENISAIEPMELDHQKNMDDWLIVEKIEDILVGSSKKFENVRIK